MTLSKTPPSKDQVFRPLAYVVLASSEKTARSQYTAVYASNQETASKKPLIATNNAQDSTKLQQ